MRPRGFAAAGYGGQHVYVLPAERIVVATTAHPDAGRHVGFAAVERRIEASVAGAIRPAEGGARGGSSGATP